MPLKSPTYEVTSFFDTYIFLLCTTFVPRNLIPNFDFIRTFDQALLLSEELANVPFLVLGNKIDLGRAASEEDLRYTLGLYETYGKEVSLSDEEMQQIDTPSVPLFLFLSLLFECVASAGFCTVFCVSVTTTLFSLRHALMHLSCYLCRLKTARLTVCALSSCTCVRLCVRWATEMVSDADLN